MKLVLTLRTLCCNFPQAFCLIVLPTGALRRQSQNARCAHRITFSSVIVSGRSVGWGLGTQQKAPKEQESFQGVLLVLTKSLSSLGHDMFFVDTMLKQILFKRCVCEPLLDFLPKGTSCVIWSTNCSSRDEVFAPIQVLVSECCRGSVVDT